MSWKCSVARFPKDPTGVSSTALPIGLPKSHRKPGNFSRDRQSAEIGQLIPNNAAQTAICGWPARGSGSRPSSFYDKPVFVHVPVLLDDRGADLPDYLAGSLAVRNTSTGSAGGTSAGEVSSFDRSSAASGPQSASTSSAMRRLTKYCFLSSEMAARWRRSEERRVGKE